MYPVLGGRECEECAAANEDAFSMEGIDSWVTLLPLPLADEIWDGELWVIWEAAEGIVEECWVRCDEEGGIDEAADGSEDGFRGVAEDDESEDDRGTNCETEEMPRGGGWDDPCKVMNNYVRKVKEVST